MSENISINIILTQGDRIRAQVIREDLPAKSRQLYDEVCVRSLGTDAFRTFNISDITDEVILVYLHRKQETPVN